MKNREIKFRVWDNVDYMSKPFELRDIGKSVQFTSDCPVMQFTGISDRAGKDIYDMDILEAKGGSLEYKQGKTELLEIGTRFKVMYHEGAYRLYKLTSNKRARLQSNTVRLNGLEIIGNEFENPDLLPTP